MSDFPLPNSGINEDLLTHSPLTGALPMDSGIDMDLLGAGVDFPNPLDTALPATSLTETSLSLGTMPSLNSTSPALAAAVPDNIPPPILSAPVPVTAPAETHAQPTVAAPVVPAAAPAPAPAPTPAPVAPAPVAAPIATPAPPAVPVAAHAPAPAPAVATIPASSDAFCPHVINPNDNTPYVTGAYKYNHPPTTHVRSHNPSRDVLLTYRQAEKLQKSLPKGYRFVPVDRTVAFTPFPHTPHELTAAPSDASTTPRHGPMTTSRSNRSVRAPTSYNNEHVVLDDVMRKCRDLLTSLMSQKNAHVFNEPVDPIAHGAPNYFDIIKNPMDLGTVQQKLRGDQYDDIHQFADDVRLTFQNAMVFNPPDNWVHMVAAKMLETFNSRFETIVDFADNGGKRKKSKGSRKRGRDDDDDDDTEDEEGDMPMAKGMNPMMQQFMMMQQNMHQGKMPAPGTPAYMMMMQQFMFNMMMGQTPMPPAPTPRPKVTRRSTATAASPSPAYPTRSQEPLPPPPARGPPRAKPAPPPRALQRDGPMLRQTEENIRMLQDDLALLTPEQAQQFLDLLKSLCPDLDLTPQGEEFNIDLSNLDPSAFHELHKFVRDMKDMNAQRSAMGHAALLTSPAMQNAGYMGYGSPLPTPLGAGAHLVSDSDSSSSDSDSDSD